MCGVVAELSADGARPGWPFGALRALDHRGPDGATTWIAADRRCALGHTRLALVDIDGGAQPMTNEDGSVVAVVNGEFYGFEAHREALIRRGHVLRTRCDSEILVHLYEEAGVDCLADLRGEFAFVLWDARERRLFAARDRFGVKPLVWSNWGGALRIASEAKALHALGIPAGWDDDAVRRVSCHQYLAPDRSLFQHIHTVPPGTMLLARAGDAPRLSRYWEMDFPEEGRADLDDPDEATEALARALSEAVRLRLQGEAPLAVHLSGGLDSSAIAGLVAQDRPVHAYSVVFDEVGWDESAIARSTAEHLGATWHPVRARDRDLADALPVAVGAAEGLAINAHLSAKWLLSRAIRDGGFKAALSGEGSDEVLAGYPHLRQDWFVYNGHDPSGIARLTASNLVTAGIQLPNGAGLSLAGVEARLGFRPTFLQAKAGFGLRMTSLLSPRERALLPEDPFGDLLDALPTGAIQGRHPVDQSAWLWSRLALAGSILRVLGDGTEMANSVEGRVPFLDHHLFEVARRIPLGLKIRAGVEKWVLREAARPFITDTVYRREKHPFMAPPIANPGSATAALLHDALRTPGALPPMFDAHAVLALLDRLPALPAPERVAWDAPLCAVLTAALLQRAMKLGDA
jgi:asparagine synthase (glutamine-hydrolysing)